MRQNSKRIIRRRRTASSAQNQRIARVFPFQDTGQHNAWRQFGFQILEAMHRDINAAIGQRFMYFLGEKALAANIGQALVLHLVAGCRDDVFFQRAIFGQRRDGRARHGSEMPRLPKRKRRAARANAHGLRRHSSKTFCRLGPCEAKQMCQILEENSHMRKGIAPDQFLVHVGFPGQALHILIGADGNKLLPPFVR